MGSLHTLGFWLNHTGRFQLSQSINNNRAGNGQHVSNLGGINRAVLPLQLAENSNGSLALRNRQCPQSHADSFNLLALLLSTAGSIMQHLHTYYSSAIFCQQQIIIREIHIVFSHNQGANPLTYTIDRYNGSIFTIEFAHGIFLAKSTGAALGTKVGRGFINFLQPVDIMLWELAGHNYMLQHNIAFKIIQKSTTIYKACCIHNVDISIYNIAQYSGHFLIVHIVKTLQYPVYLSSTLQKC